MWIHNKKTVIRGPQDIVIDGVQHPAQIFLNWTKEELASLDIKPFQPATYSSGFRVISSELEEKEGVVFERLELEKLPQETPVAGTQESAYDYIQSRERAYPGVDELIVALWEKVVEGRNGPAEELQAARLEVKNNFPKPDEKVLI